MELKGKQLSLGAKIAAVIFVLLCFAVMLTTKIVIPINDVIKIGTFIALVFSPVDISLWLSQYGKCFKNTVADIAKTAAFSAAETKRGKR